MQEPSGVVVVTGGSGFLGRHVVAASLARGERVLALVRDEATVALLPEHDRLIVRRAGIDTVDGVHAALDGVSVRAVIHLAGGRIPGGMAELPGNLELSLRPTAALVAALAGRAPIDAFVLASSGEVYGPVATPYREGAAARPVTAYACAKRLAEELILAAHGATGLPAVVARIAVAYGPGQLGAPMLVPSLLAAALQGRPFEMSAGLQTRDFIYVDDVAEALVDLARTPEAAGEIVNVSTGVETRVCDVATRLAEAFDPPAELRLGVLPGRPDDTRSYCLANEKLVRLTGRAPAVSLSVGLERTVAEARARSLASG